jgi:hypothetical protein
VRASRSAKERSLSGFAEFHGLRRRKAPRPAPARHRWVDQWLIAKGPALRQLTAETLAAVDRHEGLHHPRARARRPADRASHQMLVEVLTANLAHAVLDPPPGGRLAIRAGNPAKGAGRRDNPVFGKGVRPLIGVMHEMGVLDFKLPDAMRGEVSSIAPTASFATCVRAQGITLGDLGEAEGEEVLVLTRNVGTKAAKVTDHINYRETAETEAMRDAVRRVNAFLSKADLEFLEDGLMPYVDPHLRLLKRRFVLLKGDKVAERFDRGGRLFGGFWTNLESSRRRAIRIRGEPIADLDYSSMFARLAYAEMGEEAPEGDPYALPGLEGFRSGVKLAFNVFLFDGKGQRTKWPAGKMGIGAGNDADAKKVTHRQGNDLAHNYEGLLPAGWEDPRQLRAAILTKHPALRKAFGRGLGYGL